MSYVSPWTTDLAARLVELRAAPEGYSFSKVAEMLSQEFGLDVTRNACLAKARRLGLARPRSRKAAAVPIVKSAPVQSSSAPPAFVVEVGSYRMTVEFEHIGGRRL